MDYFELYSLLKNKVSTNALEIEIDNEISVRNFIFQSENCELLQGHPHLRCKEHQLEFCDEIFHTVGGHTEKELDVIDSEVNENKQFVFHIFIPKHQKNSTDAIILMHGFNEKSWDKYLPWAYQLTKQTHQCVVLFPIAFHMNRAMPSWSDKRLMHAISQERQKEFPDLLASSFSNVAISNRLQAKPQRFIWSGLQTYYDVVQFVRQCKEGHFAPIAHDTQFHFFTYSIGTLLAEILKITNHKGYFTNAKLCAFCGGATFNRLTPVSRTIIDSEANVALYTYLIEHLESHIQHEKRLRHFMEEHIEGQSFRMMLNFKYNRLKREALFQQYSADIFAITLENDCVVPPYDIVSTLKGASHKIPTNVIITDFDYPYTHETPFSLKENIREKVDAAFHWTFDRFSSFLTAQKNE
jgi:hypothetical protein